MLRRRARLIVRWFALERTRRVLMYLPKSVTAPRSRSLSKAARKGPRSKISVDRWSNLLGWLKQAWFTDLANLKELGTQACLDFVHGVRPGSALKSRWLIAKEGSPLSILIIYD